VLDADMVNAIDARVRQGEREVMAFGVVNSVDSDVDCTVTFNGSMASIPCKNFGNIQLIENDAVGVAKVEDWWTVFGIMSARWQSENGTSVQQSFGSTTSSTFVDMPNTAQFTFVKYYDATRIKVWASGSASTSVNNTQFTFCMKLDGANSGVTRFDVGSMWINPTGQHVGWSDEAWLTDYPADIYTVTAGWRRNSGTGTLSVDQNDRYAHSCKEIM
jgi:hypothetical protein